MPSSHAHGCRNSGLPLGGIGAGSVEIRPDGTFHRWLLMNNRPWGAGSSTEVMERLGLRFVLMADDGRERLWLNLADSNGMDPGLDSWYWIADPYHVPWVTFPESIDYTARWPFAELAYRFRGLPLTVRLKAWSPFVPHDAAASNTPGAVLEFAVDNPTDRPWRLSLVALIKNPVGYDHPNLPCAASLVREDGFAGAVMTRPGLPERCTSRGTCGFFFSDAGARRFSFSLHPRSGRDLWDPLFADGRLDDVDCGREGAVLGEIGAERTVTGPTGHPRLALCTEFEVAPGTSTGTTGLLTWHFPVFLEQEQELHASADDPGREGRRQAEDIGVQYTHRFNDALAVGRWLHRERGRLGRLTGRFAAALHGSSLPEWERDAVAATLSVLTRAAWWDRAGRFGIWEGMGCCGLQTVDVGHYGSFPILQFFPELDRSANRLSADNRHPDGKVPHMLKGNFSACDCPCHERGRIDLGTQFVLAVWRHVLWTGDLAEGRRQWPVVVANLEWMAQADENGDGLPDNRGPDQTYDRFPIFGTSALVGGLYLAALKAAADLAQRLGDTAAATRYRGLVAATLPILDRQLWNGRYYNLSHDAAKNAGNTGCMVDQANADWFLRQCGDPGLLPDERVRSAMRAILEHNTRRHGQAVWLANCSFPHGGGVTITRKGSDQVNAPWSGVEYAFAAHLVLLGLRDEARAVATAVFDRYEHAGMRHNHIECGEFYYRCMAAWALYGAEFGLAWDAFARRLTLAPQGRDCRCLVAVPGGSAEARWNAASRTLTLEGLTGSFAIARLVIDGRETVLPQEVTITTDGTVAIGG
jgi:uncharacterized protein (DUF608 family)